MDPDLAPLLSRLRRHEQTLEDVHLLNSRLARPSDIRLDQHAKAVCPLNTVRYSMNLQATITYARERQQRTWIFLSKHSPVGCPYGDALKAGYAKMDDSKLKVV